MAYRCSMMAMGLAATLLGCGSDGFGPAPQDDGGVLATETAMEGSSTSGGARDVDGGVTTNGGDAGTTWGGGSSGGVEEGGGQPTTFGMSDDMPLVADIPDIKRGLVGEDAWISIEHVRPSTGPAQLGGATWFYVQDPTAAEYMGLRVLVLPGDFVPAEDRWVDLVGYVTLDAQGWMLQLDTVVEGGVHSGVEPRRVHVADLTATNAEILDDSVVDVIEPNLLLVTRLGPVPGTVVVGRANGSSGALLVDLRPFGLTDLVPPAGAQLWRLRGVVEIGGPRPVILPRTSDDLVVAG